MVRSDTIGCPARVGSRRMAVGAHSRMMSTRPVASLGRHITFCVVLLAGFFPTRSSRERPQLKPANDLVQYFGLSADSMRFHAYSFRVAESLTMTGLRLSSTQSALASRTTRTR